MKTKSFTPRHQRGVKELHERVRRTRRKPDFTVYQTTLPGVKEMGGKKILLGRACNSFTPR